MHASVVLCLTLSALIAQAPPPAQAPSETLRGRLEHLHETPSPTVRGVRLLRPDAVVHFFEARNFQPAWDGEDVRGIAQAIRDSELDGLNPRDYHQAIIDAAATAGSPAVDLELQIVLADAVAALVDHVRYGKVRPVTLDRRWNVDPRDGAPTLESMIERVAAARSAAGAIEDLKPAHFIYRGLKTELAARRREAASGGWPALPAGAPLKPGASDARVEALRRRLAASGDLAAGSAGTVYDEALAGVVKRFQERHRLTADGVIGGATLAALNVTAAARVDQVRVNLERARWVVGGLSDSFVLVNLPAFKAYLIRDRKNVWETRAQVGRAGRQTPTFRADMKYLVLNPDWTVPPTIAAQDVIGPMRRGDNAVARKRLAIIDRQGRRVSPDAIDWANVSARNFPYTLRQAPGANNALGRVKFIFPNEHSIFLHDTPSRELFSADERTFSSGCIRVENPLDLATILLEGQDGWTRERIDEVVESGKTETVFLKTPLQVLIVYWTVTVGASGDARYARDIYNLDGVLRRALDAPAATTVPVLTRPEPAVAR